MVLAVGATTPATGAASPVIPSDPMYQDQANLQPAATIGAPDAWQVADGHGVVVAVLDSGVDLSHPDLRGALWTNPGEIPGNGIDDDHDGFVDDVHGADFVNHDGDPTDDNGHGTHIAGIIAARADGEGVVGLAPQAQVMPVKVLDANKSGDTDTVAEGMRYALAHGANVISLSINGPGAATNLEDAIQEAGAHGVTVVTSAGNSGQNLGLTPSYPASFTEANVLTVGATDGDSVLAQFSNFGSTVRLTAPGVEILSTAFDGGYELRSGTSMAAPEVAAALALMHSARPDLPDSQLRDTLVATARHAPGLSGLISGGALDVSAALHAIVPADRWPAEDPAPVLTARVRRAGASAARARTLITWQVKGDASSISRFTVTRAGRTVARRAGRSARGAWITGPAAALKVSAWAADGSRVRSR